MRKLVLILAAIAGAALLWPHSVDAQGIGPCTVSAAPTSLSVTNTSANTHLGTCGNTVIVMNITSQEAFLNVGSSSSTAATTAGWSVPGNWFVTLNVAPGSYLAAITASGTTTLRLIQGMAQ